MATLTSISAVGIIATVNWLTMVLAIRGALIINHDIKMYGMTHETKSFKEFMKKEGA